MGGGAAHLSSHVHWGKVTVMDLLMEVLMMVMMDAKEILYVEATTVRNLGFISMKKTIAVTLLPQLSLRGPHQSLYLVFL